MVKEKIDWDKIHRRIETVNAALERGFSPGPEEKKKTLKVRGEILAQQPKEIAAGEYLEVVEFILGQESYGIETRYVREVYPMKDFTPAPCTPNFVLGLINVRGQILSVIDMKKFFDMPEKGLSDLNKVVIVHSATMEFGILADAIVGVRNIRLSELQSPLPTLTGIREEFLRGVTRERMVILDAERLLHDQNIVVQEEV